MLGANALLAVHLQQNFSSCFAALKQSEGANCVSEGDLVANVRGLPFHLQINE
jgi:hypothetical protein